ncbi:MAG: Basic proline-rich protein precursor, partial [Labilithrix sp.]|nr:Basic proline-rich protein precursor [Labilithrix sp.]
PPLPGSAPPRAPELATSFTLELPSPEAPPSGEVRPAEAEPAAARASSAPPEGGTASRRPPRRHSMGMVAVETRAPPAYDPRAEPDSAEMPAAPRVPSAPERVAGGPPDPHARPTPMRPPPGQDFLGPSPARSGSMRPPMNTPLLDADLPPASKEEVARAIESERAIRRRSVQGMVAIDRGAHAPDVTLDTSRQPPPALHGSSLPPYRVEAPAPLLPKAPLMPKLGGASDELAEHLALPAGISGEGLRWTGLPKSVLEARIAFTQLARELGLDYRLKRGIELRADVSGIEAMQAVLLERFPEHVIRTSDDAYELRRHGALLSEIVARRLDAEWIDISPAHEGEWAMIVPPDLRIWPFGRVARLVAMGHRERDLVSFFLELQSRVRG